MTKEPPPRFRAVPTTIAESVGAVVCILVPPGLAPVWSPLLLSDSLVRARLRADHLAAVRSALHEELLQLARDVFSRGAVRDVRGVAVDLIELSLMLFYFHATCNVDPGLEHL